MKHPNTFDDSAASRDVAEKQPLSNPSRAGAVIFRGKVIALQCRRALQDAARREVKRYSFTQDRSDAPIVAESKTALWYASGEDNQAERVLLLGKVHNLRVAVRRLNGIIIPAGETFSFWKQIKRVAKHRGYVQGRELREGCLIPNIGGGLCQLSNALYDAALKADCEIVERHAHSRIVPGSLAEQNRDATVFWNYVDLRFRHVRTLRMEAMLTAEHLIVRFRQVEAEETAGAGAKKDRPELQVTRSQNGRLRAEQARFTKAQGARGNGASHVQTQGEQVVVITDTHDLTARVHLTLPASNSCASCGIDDCFRNIPAPSITDEAAARGGDEKRTAYLVDDLWQEFDDYLQEPRRRVARTDNARHASHADRIEDSVDVEAGASDLLCVPIDGARFKRPNYAWRTDGFAEVKSHPSFAVWRGVRSRKLAAQGARRQRLLLEQSARLAELYAKHLAWDVSHVVIAQSLLPHLWRAGHLGGRTFDVLMTALPMRTLQERLDEAHRLHPTSRTLADFRAEDRLLGDEWDALASARRIVTTHTDIARLFAHKSIRLDWHLPQVDKISVGKIDEENDVDKSDLKDRAPTNARPTSAQDETRESAGNARGKKIVFPASTLGRKGAYEMREAARELNLSVIICGAVLEDADFWQGLDVERREWSAIDFQDVAAVVLPAFVEHKPRRLLEAVARGVPVIASTACGLEATSGIVSIEPGNAVTLGKAISDALAQDRRQK